MASTRFEAASKALFFKSPRPNDLRIGELAMPTAEASLHDLKPGFVLIGHPDDEGIKENFGRLGSREAPDAIRAALYRLTPGRKDFPALYDLGNFKIFGTLQARQEQEKKILADTFRHGHRLILLGGGHDHAYPDITGFLDNFSKFKPLVINMDSHLDVRPSHPGPHSGSPFYQLLEERQDFELVEIGIQPFCNSLEHVAYAKKKNVKLHTLSQCHRKLGKVFSSLSNIKRPVFLSIDIDVFSSAYAPGASASYPTGLDPNEFIELIPWIASNLNVRGIGIYEVSPPLDQDQRTVKLSAILLHSFLLHFKHKGKSS